jgi:hypothetical protein
MGDFVGLIESFVRSPRRAVVFFTAVLLIASAVVYAASAQASPQINLQRAIGISRSIASAECHRREVTVEGQKVVLCTLPDAQCEYTFPDPRHNVGCFLSFFLTATGPGGGPLLLTPHPITRAAPQA